MEYTSPAGEDLTSDSSDTSSGQRIVRHHLLRHKLTLDKETSGEKAVPKSEEERQKRARKECKTCKRTYDIRNRSVWTQSIHLALISDFNLCQADSDSTSISHEFHDDDEDGMVEVLSVSEDEASGEDFKRYFCFSCHWVWVSEKKCQCVNLCYKIKSRIDYMFIVLEIIKQCVECSAVLTP